MPTAFFDTHCVECHDADTRKGGLDLTSLKQNLGDEDNFALWVRIHDRIELGEMPPKKRERPKRDEMIAATTQIAKSLTDAEQVDAESRSGLRRLTRGEYENTVRDLFDLPGIALQAGLPADGSAHGFDNNSDALDISHVNMAKYIEAADKTLDMAIATRPTAPPSSIERLSLAGNYEPDIMLMQGDAVLLRDKKHDPVMPPAGAYAHVNQGAHESLGVFDRMSSVGVFRHEDESWNAYFRRFAALYPGRYRVRASFWSLQWDKGQILPSRGVEAARLSVVQFNENGRGGQHPSYVLGYYDAPSLKSQIHELDVWLNFKETFGFNVASLAPVVLYRVGTWGQLDRTMGYTGPCIANDWVEVEGPLYDVWPPRAHQLLFGDLPLTEFKEGRAPVRLPLKQEITGARNKPEATDKTVWTVQPEQPLIVAGRLLASFLPKAFRRPVSDDIRKAYVAKCEERLKAGDCFETAMRWVYRAALCSPDFLYHVEPAGRLDHQALAARLSYFLWNSTPDETLLAQNLNDSKTLHAQVERLLKDPKSQRFIEDFLGQWLKLRAIAANDPDKKLYPEFSPYLQDSMVAETRAYFRELLENDLAAGYLVQSDFAMLNEKLAVHYGIAGVSGPKIRKVKLPKDCPRGGFLTQAAVLKITANGTTTSPVVRGAYVMARLLGKPPQPPPPNVPAVEPDVQGATTIRELLNKHRNNSACAGCHAEIDPPGFALESFDVIGGFRERYRSNDKGDKAPRGSIDPKIPIGFKLGPAVDASGEMPGARKFAGITDFKTMLAADKHLLLKNLAQQFLVYATGRPVAFSDRAALNDILTKTEKQGGGVRTLIHEIVQSPLFQTH
ncbi:DUF1592 domain-containing protein [Prosthecobacter sp.]|uniref:DUF1592 domain-containing protein n=1 Tax=Prosthecobacter sp. TaxID=1965333 RepID=UPI001D53F63F|nr:DUF1592 domain-containing protein [Prosthecobacter sp.]MCB1275962.1 DUF1592 domain-containing protein [Prosthecobacter sp.]